MMPCKVCEDRVGLSPASKGLKQVGKTRHEGTRFERRYRCQDCGATCIMRGDLAQVASAPPFLDEWLQPI